MNSVESLKGAKGGKGFGVGIVRVNEDELLRFKEVLQ